MPDSAPEPQTRMTRRQARTGAPAPGTMPRLPVTVRPPAALVLVAAGLCVLQPSRVAHRSLLVRALEDPTSTRALPYYATALVGLTFVALFARTWTRLSMDQSGHLVVTRRGMVRRRSVILERGDQVVLASGPKRALLLRADRGQVAVLPLTAQFWVRGDVWGALHQAGVSVDYDHRLNTFGDVEREYPGVLPWIERSALRPYGLATLAVVAGVVVLGCLLSVAT